MTESDTPTGFIDGKAYYLPAGYEPIKASELIAIEESTKRRLEKLWREIEDKNKVILSQAELNRAMQLRMDRAITQHREVREEMRQLRFALARPLKWLWLTLKGRAISAERNERFRHMNDLIETGRDSGSKEVQEHRSFH